MDEEVVNECRESEQASTDPRSLGSQRINESELPKKAKFSKKRLQLIHDDYERRGVVYINYIPRKLTPYRLKMMLSQYGSIGRIYLAPEDPKARQHRKRTGGDRSKRFNEGWVEFLDKKVAKRVTRMLNGEPMGGNRRSPFYSCLWCMKYLPKFKWDHLREEIAYHKATYEQKLAQELRDAKHEREFYLSQVDLARRDERCGKRSEDANDDGITSAMNDVERMSERGMQSKTKRQRYFHQREARSDPATDGAAPEISIDVLKMLAGSQAHQEEV